MLRPTLSLIFCFLYLMASASAANAQANADALTQSKNETVPQEHVDAVMVGGGIMSATLATLLHELNPQMKIEIYERLDEFGCESSDTLNNAGSGHAALCELNYTPELQDGSIDISKAIEINKDFQVSKQFWSYLVQHNDMGSAEEFIHQVPHLSWVQGEANVRFLRKRYEALKKNSLFQDMEYTEDLSVLRQWMPLMMRGRTSKKPMAATRSFSGTDVDYGRLTRMMLQNVTRDSNVRAMASHKVQSFVKMQDGHWLIEVKDRKTGISRRIRSPFVFIGAGGGTLLMLQRSGVKEAAGYGGFPVGGEFLVYKGTELSDEHFGKVYGQAAEGAPPMSVPHLDTRIINGKKHLIFGPFASATTRFLKRSSVWDLANSVQTNNLLALLQAGAQNLNLVKYLVEQERQNHEQRMDALREFIPSAVSEEWQGVAAGKRVQIIKKRAGPGGKKNVLQFGTEVVTTADGSLAALLGASPGASTSVSAMLEVLNRSFKTQMQSPEWKHKISKMTSPCENYLR